MRSRKSKGGGKVTARSTEEESAYMKSSSNLDAVYLKHFVSSVLDACPPFNSGPLPESKPALSRETSGAFFRVALRKEIELIRRLKNINKFGMYTVGITSW